MRQITLLCGLWVSLAGCVTTGPSDSTGARLPDGVTLLESDQNRCAGVVHVDQGASGSRNIVLRPGQNASFRVSDERIEWTCIGETSTTDGSVVCPSSTSYARITRPAAGEQFLLECYG